MRVKLKTQELIVFNSPPIPYNVINHLEEYAIGQITNNNVKYSGVIKKISILVNQIILLSKRYQTISVTKIILAKPNKKCIYKKLLIGKFTNNAHS